MMPVQYEGTSAFESRQSSPHSSDSVGLQISSTGSGHSGCLSDFNSDCHSMAVPSSFRYGDQDSDEFEALLYSDVQFIQLPRRVTKALLRFRRVVLDSSGGITPLPYEPDEPLESDDRFTNTVDPVQRRVLCALDKERSRRLSGIDEYKADDIASASEDKENMVEDQFEKRKQAMQGEGDSIELPSDGEVSSDVEMEELDMGLYSALGFSSGQIDRLLNAPLWAPLPKKLEMQDEDAEEEESPLTELERKPEEKPDPAERSWEVAVILRPHTVKYPNGSKEKEYMVIWKDWPWNDCWSLAPDCFDDGDKKLAAADTRERLISQMASYMQMKDRKSFEELFPKFHKRHDYTSWHRVHLRLIEQSINDELEGLDIAPIYFENWTNDERATIDVKYLTRCAMSISNYREAKETGVALRMQYPDDGAGCDCKDGQCSPSCPCVKIMGRDQIRMRSTGKIDVEKLAEATTVECGTTCSCDASCPSRYAERGRKVPLVVLYTMTKGWSVYAPQIIPAGTFLGSYTGEIIPLCTAIAQGVSTSYQFTNIHQIPGTKQYVVDASRMGNETRYFNHACGDAANLKAVSLLSRGNLLTNNMLFFTKRRIAKGEELTFSYRGKDMEEQKNGIRCLCTPGCQSRL